MGSVVGIRRQCWALNSKLWTQLRKRRGLFCSSKSLFSGAKDWDQSTFYLTMVRSWAQQNTTVFSRVLLSWHVAGWSRMQSLTGARASLWVAAKAGGMKLSSVQKGAQSVSCSGAAALVKPRVCHCSAGWECFWKGGHGSGAEVSQVDWARFMLVKRSTGHLWLSELIGRLHSSVHWL